MKEIVAASKYQTVISLGGFATIYGFFSSPHDVAVDVNGNVFVANTGNNNVAEIFAAGNYQSVTTLGGVYSSPSGVAVDGSGNVYVADAGNNAAKEIFAAGGYTTVKILGSGFRYPTCVAVDGSGNVYVTDSSSGAVKEIVSAATNFQTINIGTTRTPFAIPFTITGNGTFGTPVVLTQGATGQDFAYVSTGSTCSGALTSGTSCTVNLTFTPPGSARTQWRGGTG